MLAGDASTAAVESYVSAVYRDLLHRPADVASLAYWTSRIEQGQPITRFATEIAHSHEFYSTLIADDYRAILGRNVDDTGLNYWLGFLDAGMSDAQFEAELSATDEFFQRAGGTDETFIQGLYQNMLGRSVDVDAQHFWLEQMQAGASRAEISRDLAFSPERREQRVAQDYADVLHQAPDPQGLVYWSRQLAGGLSNEDLSAAFASSHVYFNEQSGQPITTVPLAPDDSEWRSELAQIDAQAQAADPPVLFVGDSITANWTVGPGLPVWNQVFAPLGAMQAGIYGDETQGVLWRLDHSELSNLHPKLVVLMIGTNNLTEGDSPADVAQGIEAIVTRLRQLYPDAHLALMGVLPRGATADDPLRQAVDQVNSRIQGLADGVHVTYVDFSSSLLNPDGTFRPGTMLPGLIHIDLPGYAAWTSAIMPEVKAALG